MIECQRPPAKTLPRQDRERDERVGLVGAVAVVAVVRGGIDPSSRSNTPIDPAAALTTP
jgi:hypothetical protein